MGILYAIAIMVIEMRAMPRIRRIGSIMAVMAALLVLASDASIAQTPIEDVIFVPSQRDTTISFEVTVFTTTQAQDTTAPIVIINHGTSPNKEQGRERSIAATNFFLKHGCMVILPMRRGFSRTRGERVRIYGCDLTRYGLDNAYDIEDVVLWLRKQPAYRSRKIVMIGQSTGGLATMAYSSLKEHRVDAIINFHGGVRSNTKNDCKWQARIDAFKEYARTSSPPSLWFYTANDHSSNPEYIAMLYKAYTDAGGKAELHQLPAFEDDGHYLFAKETGGPIWQPLVLDYLKKLNIILK